MHLYNKGREEKKGEKILSVASTRLDKETLAAHFQVGFRSF